MLQLFQEAKKIFRVGGDPEVLKVQEERVRDLMDIAALMERPEAQKLRQSVIADIETAMRALIKTRDEQYISDLAALFKLLEKLSPQSELDAIKQWLEERLSE